MKRTKRFELIQDEYGIITTLYDSLVKTFWGQVTFTNTTKIEFDFNILWISYHYESKKYKKN